MHPGIESWKNLLIYAFNAFSIPLHLRTLLSPWKRDRNIGPKYGLLEKIVFSILSRLIGFVFRVVLIILGLIFTLIIFITFPIFAFVPIKMPIEQLVNLGSIGASLSYGETYFLNSYSRDVEPPSNVELYGKEKTIRMLERGLSRENSHNVLLVGYPGSGKTTIVNYLGKLGKSGLSNDGVRNHRVVELFAEQIKLEDFDKAMREAVDAGNIILVIENIHAYENLFERLMPYLDSKELEIVVTTDFTNFDKVLKNYPEFLSRFEKVDVLPTNADDTYKILRSVSRRSHIAVKDEALREIVRLSERFIPNQSEPMRSLLVLEDLKTLEKKITVSDVQQVISDKTNVPIGSIGESERHVLEALEDKIREKIVGQEEAVGDVCKALIRLRTGISDPGKPAGTFLFLGPTGVGKTYTAKVLAEEYFGHKDSMIRFDMTEFSLPESVDDFTNRLTALVEESPLSLVFFDELEKSNKQIQNLFLQILDEGRLTRSNGREASFKDTLIIATSNAGSMDIVNNPNISKTTLLDKLIKDNIFAPEFINRFSSVVLFKPLEKAEVRNIARLLLGELKVRLQADNNVNLEITDALIDKVAQAGFDPLFGARPIKRAIEDIVEDEVAKHIMKGDAWRGVKII